MWTVLLVAALAAQAAWPAHARAAAARPVAVVNGVTLMSDRLEAVVGTLLPLESFHQSVSPERIAAIRQRALAQIVDEELVYQDGTRRGVVVTAVEVEAAFADLKKSYRSTGEFTAAMATVGATPGGVRAELRRKLTIAKNLERIAAACAVTAAEARRYYDDHPERFVEPERLHLHVVTISADPSGGQAARDAARSRAEDLHRRLRAGAAFEGDDMGLLHRGSLTPAFEEAVAGLHPGQLSGVVESLYGYHILRLTEIRPARQRTFADVGARLRDDLTAERCASAQTESLSALRARAAIEYPR